jgi:hypothetical protein
MRMAQSQGIDSFQRPEADYCMSSACSPSLACGFREPWSSASGTKRRWNQK